MAVSLDCIERSVTVIALYRTSGRCVYLEETTLPLLSSSCSKVYLYFIDKQRSTPHTPLCASCEYLLVAEILIICYIHGSYQLYYLIFGHHSRISIRRLYLSCYKSYIVTSALIKRARCILSLLAIKSLIRYTLFL